MRHSEWTDREWEHLIQLVRRTAPVSLSNEEIREAAWSYMHVGADGGGNRFGIEGTVVTLCVDKI
jgi:hypothetical protein